MVEFGLVRMSLVGCGWRQQQQQQQQKQKRQSWIWVYESLGSATQLSLRTCLLITENWELRTHIRELRTGNWELIIEQWVVSTAGTQPKDTADGHRPVTHLNSFTCIDKFLLQSCPTKSAPRIFHVPPQPSPAMKDSRGIFSLKACRDNVLSCLPQLIRRSSLQFPITGLLCKSVVILFKYSDWIINLGEESLLNSS